MIRFQCLMINTRIIKARVMNTILYILFLVCSVLMSGCSNTKQAEDLPMKNEPLKKVPEVVIQEKEPDERIAEVVVKENGQLSMIQIQNFEVTEETLTFDYQVTNTFTYDIRVCQDTSFFGYPHVVTRIDEETVRIKLRCHLERDQGLRNPPPITKYLRLTPGESYSDKILLGLPIKNASPINRFREEYDRNGEPKERKQIVLHRVIFEVGYLGGELNQSFKREKIKDIEPDKGFTIMGPFHYLKKIPLVVDEMQDGRLREFVYMYTGTPIGIERSVQVVITDVNIPCSVVVNE